MENNGFDKGLFGEHEPAGKGGGQEATRRAENVKDAVQRPQADGGVGKTRMYDAVEPKKAAGKKGAPASVAEYLKKYNVAIVIVASLAVLTLIVSLVLPGVLGGWHGPGVESSNGASGISSASGTESLSESGSGDDGDYDPDENAIDADKYSGTVLPESDKAGDSYIDETLFLGDSNTVRMLAYRDVTKVSMQNCIGYEGMGITSFRSLKFVTFRLDNGTTKAVALPEAVKLLQPRRVLINFGTNNVGGMGVKSFIEQYEKAIDAVKESYEYADIIVASIFPVDKYHTYGNGVSQKKIDEFNAALVELAEKMEVKFLNWSEAMKDPASGFSKNECTIGDGVHISKEGATAAFDYFLGHSFITDDKRPKPLEPIPKREGNVPGLIIQDPEKGSGPRESSSKADSVELLVSVYDDTEKKGGSGGVLKYEDVEKRSFTVYLKPEASMGKVVAVPNEGYEFSHWSCTHGRIDDYKSPNLPGYTMPGHVEIGSKADLTAHFVKRVTVPDFKKLNYDNGEVKKDGGWTFNIVRKLNDVEKGVVYDQTPAAGTVLEAGVSKVVTLVVSDGPMVEMPAYELGKTGAADFAGQLGSKGFTNVKKETVVTNDNALNGKLAYVSDSYPPGTKVHYKAEIIVREYVYQATPSPTPSPSPSPDPTPSPSADPTPSPSPDPTVEPSPTDEAPAGGG